MDAEFQGKVMVRFVGEIRVEFSFPHLYFEIDVGNVIDIAACDFRFCFGGSPGGSWFVKIGRDWTLRDGYIVLHLAEMSCVDVWRRGRAVLLKRFMSPLL